MTECPACRSEIPDGARFCQTCGAEIATATVGPGAAAASATDQPPRVLPPPVMPVPLPPVAPYAYPPPPYPVVPGQPYAPAHSGKAVAGMWLGIASVPAVILSWVGIVVGVLGLIFSLLGLGEIRQRERYGVPAASGADRAQAIAGIICSVVGIAASSAFLVYILTHLDDFGIKLTR